MTKHTFKLEEDYDFEMIGVSCHTKNYKLCWTINNALNINLIRLNDFDILKKKETLSFSFYEYIDNQNNIEYYLIANKSELGYLIPEKQVVDYFIILKGHTEPKLITEITTILNRQEIILMAHQIDVATLKSKKNLLF
ncbi:MAG: IPExxxVDY family protein [Vicingaceae bacterium]|nr:IPExxxVDY family protein [Vicingaceae bacterium]